MKLAKKLNHCETIHSKPKDFTSLLLENREDVLIYKAINEQIKAKQSINFWFGFKSQTFHDSILSYSAHEIGSDNKMAHALPMAIYGLGKDKVSLLDYCNISDNIINGMHTTMLEMITDGKKIRINQNGGYCSLLPDEEFDLEQEINEQELYNYLIYNEIDFEFKIKSDTLVIENDSRIPQELIKTFTSITGIQPENLQVITGFKQKTILFKDKDYLSFFSDGIKQGLKNIVFQSTSQDLRQLKGVRDVLETLLTINSEPLNIYIKSWRFEKLVEAGLFDYDRNKLNITIIK